MSTTIYAQRDKTALVAGLSWQILLRSGKQRLAEVRTAAAEGDASKIVIVEAGARAAVGLYTSPDIDIDAGDHDPQLKQQGKPKVLHSLAAAFAAKVGDGNAVLALALPVTGQYAIIVVDNGVPTVDEIRGADQATSQAMSYASGATGFTYALFTNDGVMFPSAEHIGEDDLWSLLGKQTLLGPRPANTVMLLGTAAAVLVAGVAVFGWVQFQDAQERKERLRQAAAANPTPKYREALQRQIGQLGMSRDATLKVLRHMQAQPLWVQGWLLARVECKLGGGGACVSVWARAGGTTDELVLARSSAGEEISGDSTNNEVRLTWKEPLLVETGPSSPAQLPSGEESVRVSTPTFQVWENAGISAGVGSDGYKIWPALPGIDMKSVDQSVAVKARSIEAVTVPVLAAELVATAPANIWWSSIVFEVKVSPKAADSVKVNIKGASYVR